MSFGLESAKCPVHGPWAIPAFARDRIDQHERESESVRASCNRFKNRTLRDS
jgi:hypothetical protein